jgi:uncharacterized membrane protein HdeD (DUF308 family)
VRNITELTRASTDAAMTDEERRQLISQVGRFWWMFLAFGVLWVLFGLVVLSYRVGSLLALAVLAGVVFIMSGSGSWWPPAKRGPGVGSMW